MEMSTALRRVFRGAAALGELPGAGLGVALERSASAGRYGLREIPGENDGKMTNEWKKHGKFMGKCRMNGKSMGKLWEHVE